MNPQDLLMKRKKMLKFSAVFNMITRLHERNYEDKVVDLEDVRIVPDGNTVFPSVHMEVPKLGRLSMTDWAQRQLGSILGVNWGKWFDPEHIKAEEIQQELHRRFSRTHDTRKIRARRYDKDDPGNGDANGFVRAILSPTYSAIDDVRIFDRMSRNKRINTNEMRFMKNRFGTGFHCDKSSHYTVVTKETNLGPIDRNHPNEQVRRFYNAAEAEGLLPENDIVHQGFHLRNSEVGYTAVTIDASTFRLVCLNGAIVTVSDGRILYRMHRGISDDAIDTLLDDSLSKLPTVISKNQKMMVALQDQPVEDPEAEMLKFLNRKKTTQTFQDRAKEVFAIEPLHNRYGIFQAISRASQEEKDMDKRFELEQLAGEYMARAA